MQFKLSAITLALATLAVATPTSRTTAPSPGNVCCTTVESASSPSAVDIFKSLGIDASSITGLVGLGCSPITVVGAGSGTCSSTTVTCQDNSRSLISLGCVPVTL
ncbi:hydrophobin 2 [Mycena floridula]|nr:hydrophobin 2 [Mycena floridula]KAJ7572551.1 hydrophobin 2 [Mycena floridula]